jgi:hypothetical protein
MKRWLWPIGIYILAVLVLTWPLALHLSDAIPLGSERSPTVPLFNLWALGWNVNRLLHGYQEYWNAPIFYPVPGSLAFSEPQSLSGLIAAPFWAISRALAYNAVLISFLFLNGLAVYTFLRRRGLDFVPAVLGGLLALSLPFLSQERGVLHLLPFWGVILAIDGLWSLTEEPSYQAGLRLGLGLGITFLTSEQFALFLGLLSLVAIPFLLPQVHRKGFWQSVGLAAVTAAAFVLPVIVAQVESLEVMGFARSADTVTRGSAQFTDYLRPSSATWQSRWFPLSSQGNHRLFPGAVLFGLALAGAVVGLRQQRHRQWTIFLAISLTLAFLVSLGLNLKLGDWQPYELLGDIVPGFSNLRSPFRMAYFVQVYLLLLACLFLGWLGQQRRLAMALLLVGLVFLEVFPQPARLTSVPPAIKSEAIVEPAIFLPFPDDRATSAYANTASWMVASLPEATPLVNGYSGYFPTLHSQLKTLLVDFPTPGSMAALRALGVQTILIRRGWMDDAQNRRLAMSMTAGEIREVASEGDFIVYRLTDADLKPASAYDGGWALEITLEDQAIELRAFAAVPDEKIYVLAPQVAPLDWRIQLIDPEGKTSIFDVYPPNAILLYHGSDRWLRVRLPLRSGSPGQYAITLRDNANGRILGEGVLEVP